MLRARAYALGARAREEVTAPHLSQTLGQKSIPAGLFALGPRWKAFSLGLMTIS